MPDRFAESKLSGDEKGVGVGKYAEPSRTEVLRSLAIANGYRTWQPTVTATGWRSHGLTHRTLGQGGAPRVAEEFLLASRMKRGDGRVQDSTRPYFSDSGLRAVSLIECEPAPPDRIVGLPQSLPLGKPLEEAMAARRSRRQYAAQPLELAELATILRTACGISGRSRVRLNGGGEVSLPLHTAPTGGGLCPVEVHVLPLRVTTLDDVAYRFDRRGEVLVRSEVSHSARGVLDTCISPPDRAHMADAGAVLIMVGRPWRTMRKYGSRGLRFMFLEAGAITQNAHLAAEALGLGSVECGSLCDDELHELLGVDGLLQTYVHAVIVGRKG
ncbi:SagB/ThcOx family dehydrogenase [Streptomyces sp. AC563]|uniref:SagB/ThcOx family dehydrogenase n=1 Tax=Streptomyces buecherae TaxID=2763006 RepID=UPI00164D4930|nr:SagB/ThcOx family dehydrogenase [Streptomyces buecherae]MBC3989704.1 SagB/ThcOx family dehydrogenase [Streptomyces buecherae]